MDYIFFCIYNTQYLDGNNRVNKTPWFDALGIMIVGSFFWLVIPVEILYFCVFNENFPGVSIAVIGTIGLVLLYLHYFLFIKDKKYELIYDRYHSVPIQRVKERIIALLYLFIPVVISALIALRWHKLI